ncbi:CCA tRNA nucleotidyltransferase [Leptospira langatensis]|uniref:CCA tRNA nucleotidyltransferase n=1 Tax=Leptospira langatensis TaxID=2484983 RepID=A0A5F1ZP72_9LEPT|nr:CCA tRNA nucleotidyltransferase [Leptospira langatensis]TGK05523.1 CCA tRNA nucleotidyltransferase [Leptospira langatensis]TGL38659.1 CCA tRNA nucleotidyltransferase [Leptospira langatensis]
MMNSDPKELIRKIPSPYLEDLLEITKTVRNANGEVYLVGGSVRDLLLEKIPHEYDMAVSLPPEEVQKIFRRTVPTGIKHGTITVLLKDRSYELTTFRKDEDYVDGRRPETVTFGVSLSEDLKRRDFTMNAIALDLANEKLVDEHEGIKDIQNSLIRTIGNPISRFTEDGLRPVRAIRFVSILGFKIHPETEKAILECKTITQKVSPERIHDEFLKLLKSKDPKPSLLLLRKYGILELFTQSKLYANLRPSQSEKGSLDKNDARVAGTRLLTEIEWEEELSHFANLEPEPDRTRLAYFLLTHFAKEELSAESTRFFKDLRFSNQRSKDSQFLARTLDSIQEYSSLLKNASAIRKWVLHPIAQYSGKKELLTWCRELASLSQAHLGNSNWLSQAEEEWKKDAALLLSDLAIDGNWIRKEFPNLPPQMLGEALRLCLEKVLMEPDYNSQEKLQELIRSSFQS